MREDPGTWHDYRREIVFAFALALALYVAWVLRHVLEMLYVGALLAVVLTPLVTFTSELRIGRWRMNKALSVFVLLAALAGTLTLFGFLALPPVIRDLEQLSGNAPARIPFLLDKLHQVPFFNRMDGNDVMAKLQNWASKAAGYLLLSIGGWATGLFNIVTTIVLTIYFILEGDGAYAWFLSFLPPQQSKRLDATLKRAGVRMGNWLLGQVTLMLILGVTSTVVYISLHIRYAYALGALTGLLNIIPVLGAAFTIALVMIVAAVDSWGRVLGVAIFYTIYLNLENSYLIPRIMRSRVDLPGLAILVSLLIGFELAGVAGGLVAVPTAVLVSVLLDEYLVYEPNKREA